MLIEAIINKLNRLQGRHIEGISDEALRVLMKHLFPGNIRELENILEHAYVLCRGNLIDTHHLPSELRASTEGSINTDGPLTLETVETRMIAEALKRRGGSRKRAAQDLGIDPSTLYRKMKRLGIR
jgi:transcriptional regulator with PAS, ATPase and Fis domain